MLVELPTEDFAIETTRALKVGRAQSDGNDARESPYLLSSTGLLVNYAEHVRVTRETAIAILLRLLKGSLAVNHQSAFRLNE